VDLERIIKIKNSSEKQQISDWISNKEIELEDISIKSVINAVSAAKSLLNSSLQQCLNLTEEQYQSNFYVQSLESKKNKVDGLIDLYNDAQLYNKYVFTDEVITFDYPTYISTVTLEIDSFNFSLPINFTLKLWDHSGNVTESKIIPFNYSGLYSEYVDLDTTSTLRFPPSVYSSLYFYNVIYSADGFSVGNVMTFTNGAEYEISNDGTLYFKRESIGNTDLLVKYQPSYNGFEIDVNKKIIKAELVAENDFTNIAPGYTKRLVVL
jgi:hypothetical protein